MCDAFLMSAIAFSLFPGMIFYQRKGRKEQINLWLGDMAIEIEYLSTKVKYFIGIWMILKVRVITEIILKFNIVIFYLKFLFVVLSADILCYTTEESFSFSQPNRCPAVMLCLLPSASNKNGSS